MTVAGDPRPLEHVALFLNGWPLREIGADATPPDIEIDADRDGFIFRSRATGTRMQSGAGPLDAANALAGAVIATHVARDPGLICLHGGAVALDKGVVVLVGDSGAGKSSVAMLLAAHGHRLFGDDRVAVAPPADAVALGLAPKMRWPLPPSGGVAFARYVEERAAWWGEDAVYLHPRPDEAAGLGERAPLAAVVLLHRDGSAGALAPMGPAQAVRDLLPHCFAPHLPAGRTVEALAALARSIAVAHLAFEDSARAAALLATAYG